MVVYAVLFPAKVHLLSVVGTPSCKKVGSQTCFCKQGDAKVRILQSAHRKRRWSENYTDGCCQTQRNDGQREKRPLWRVRGGCHSSRQITLFSFAVRIVSNGELRIETSKAKVCVCVCVFVCACVCVCVCVWGFAFAGELESMHAMACPDVHKHNSCSNCKHSCKEICNTGRSALNTTSTTRDMQR